MAPKNPKFKSVLAYPGEDGAEYLGIAVRIAGRLGARLKIVDVAEAPPSYLKILAPKYAEIGQAAQDAKRYKLDSLAKIARRRGMRVETELLIGDPAIEIVRAVLRDCHDLVLIGAGGAGGIGTAAMRLARKCPCPVWVARPVQSRKRLRILAAVDTIPGDLSRAALNVKILGMAAGVARGLGAELHALHAWTAYGESMLLDSVQGEDRRVVRKYVAETKASHQKELRALLKTGRMKLPEKQIHLLKGDSRGIIPAFCKSAKIDLLVMGTVARTGLAAALMGNTAESVANQVVCSLLAVKPDDFVCPVRPDGHPSFAFAV